MQGFRIAPAIRALALILPVALIPATAFAQSAASTSASITPGNIFDPQKAPVITIKVTGQRRHNVTQKGGQTVVSAQTIENKPGVTNFTSLIASTIPGTAAASQGEVHIRGSHGQYSYYLDGAPLPANISGSFSDLINPKNIETLRVFTGGFPAEFGGQLAAIFDVSAKSGTVGNPRGYLQQIAQGYSTYQTTTQAGGSAKDLSYFISAVRSSTASQISPVDQDVLHDGGNQAIGFLKFDYQSGANDRITLDSGQNDAHFDIPNTPQQQAVGIADDQYESGFFNNLIWRRINGGASTRLIYYSHTTHLKYNGSPGDLITNPGETDTNADAIGNSRTDEDQTAFYNGLRFDQKTPTAPHHVGQYGFDIDYVNVDQNFLITSVVNSGTAQNPIASIAKVGDVGTIYGGDRSFYAQDDWTPGRTHINYGVRYDQHNADITTTQWSPRVNIDYTAGKRDSFRAYYDKLFQPASLEDVKSLTNSAGSSGITTQQAAPFQPERDDFFQFGWTHQLGQTTAGFDTYYRVEQNTIDDDVIGNSQIDVPVNFTKGYARGLEITLDGQVSPTVSYYANAARSWAAEAGPITGGLDFGTTTPGYIFDDHDQTLSSAFGIEYDHHGTFYTLDGDYGSGFPYFGNSNLTDLEWSHPHLTIDSGYGFNIKGGQIAFTADNVFNHAYIIKQAGPFTNRQWSLGRQLGIKFTKNF